MKAGKGYRLLKVGEIIRMGDDVRYSSTSSWHETANPNKIIVKGDLPYRRKLAKKAGKKGCKGCARKPTYDSSPFHRLYCNHCTRNPAAKLTDNYRSK